MKTREKMKTILFYSPFMGHTGSEMMVKYIINNVNTYRFVLISGENGTLLSEIKTKHPVYVLPDNNIFFKIINHFFKKFFKIDATNVWFRYIIKKYSPKLVIINSIVSHKMYQLIRKNNLPFISYVHELPPHYDLLESDLLDWVVRSCSGTIGCSTLVCNYLKEIGFKNIHLFYECIDSREITIDTSLAIEIEKKLKKYRKIFVMSGRRVYEKGFHLLPELAEYLMRKNSAIIWIGGSGKWGLDWVTKKRIEAKHLDNVIFTGLITSRTEYYTWISVADAFILTSIIDPYPLVMIEAAYLKKPIFSFNSGGVNEFVKDKMGKVVESTSLNDLIKILDKFINDELEFDYELLHKEALKHDINNNIDKFNNIISSFLNN